MTSGVLNGTVPLSSTPGTTLSGQMGMTTATGSMGGASSVLTPNPATGATFTIGSPFTFYQTYTYGGFATTNQAGSMTAGTSVTAQAAPPPITIGDFVWNDLNANGMPGRGGARGSTASRRLAHRAAPSSRRRRPPTTRRAVPPATTSSPSRLAPTP